MITDQFGIDPYPGAMKILFIAPGYSSHAINWINLFEEEELNIRLFALPEHVPPPDDWPVRAYVLGDGLSRSVSESNTRKRRVPEQPQVPSLTTRIWNRMKRTVGIQPERVDRSPQKWLIEILEEWQPQIIHTLGMTASHYLSGVLEAYQYSFPGQWFLSIWGSGDTTLQQADPEKRPDLIKTLKQAHWIIADIKYNLDQARSLGVSENQFPPHPVLPGAGGVVIDNIQRLVEVPPSKRRMIVWPKVYNAYHMIGLTTLEAIKICWEHIQPCELVIPSLKGDLAMWYHTLPDSIREKTRIADRTPHPELLKIMTGARVMLAPSLLDGLPNVLIEAMAAGAFPIMSPLPTFDGLLIDGKNALLARNLYPDEIAQAIIRAMSDDTLVDQAAEYNLGLVRQIASRPDIRKKALENYQHIIAAQQTPA